MLESHVAYLTEQLARFNIHVANPIKFDHLSKTNPGFSQQNIPNFPQTANVQNGEHYSQHQNVSHHTGQFSQAEYEQNSRANVPHNSN